MRSIRIIGITAGLAAALGLALAACSGSSSTQTRSPAGGSAISTNGVVTPTTGGQASTTVTSDALSGTWSGKYTGADQGTFTLTWQQSVSNLTGTIKLSSPPVTDDISGTVQGNTISFGTLGGEATTYSGSVSGNTMSGTYQAPNGNGTWHATKAS